MTQTLTEAKKIIDDLSRALFSGRVRNSTVFLSTGVSYPNGVAVTIRVDRGLEGYVVTDDGYAALIVDGMGATSTLTKIAPSMAKRSGLSFEKGSFIATGVAQSELPIAVCAVSNLSARAVERVSFLLEQPKIRKSRDLFDRRLRDAFGDKVAFDVDYRGSTGRYWNFNAGVTENGQVVRLFELVSPSTQSVALANMKISDTRSLDFPPAVTAALVDYDRTEPALRAILSNAGGTVISANDDIAKYKLGAA